MPRAPDVSDSAPELVVLLEMQSLPCSHFLGSALLQGLQGVAVWKAGQGISPKTDIGLDFCPLPSDTHTGPSG